MTEHEIPDFDHHRKCYELLGEVWDDTHKVKDWRWQKAVYRLLGPSEDKQMLFPGDEVELLVDGCRGQFKGRTAVITYVDGNSIGVRVPGEKAPGETEDYSGPYLRDQIKFLRRGGR